MVAQNMCNSLKMFFSSEGIYERLNGRILHSLYVDPFLDEGITEFYAPLELKKYKKDLENVLQVCIHLKKMG